MSNNNLERGTKTCCICKVELPLSNFHRQAKSKDGHQSRCKPCAVRLTTEWQQQWPDRTNTKNALWKQKHQDQVRESRKKYNDEHVEQRTKYQTAYRRSLPKEKRAEINRRVDLRRKYGISVEKYDSMLIAQAGRCAICGEPVRPTRALAVDHCHKTGKNRGLLCGHCNPLLHKLEADADWMQKAVSYLNSHAMAD